MICYLSLNVIYTNYFYNFKNESEEKWLFILLFVYCQGIF